jgi:hypothetical protein
MRESGEKAATTRWRLSLLPTDMFRANDGDFRIADRLRNRNAVESLGIRETAEPRSCLGRIRRD